MGLVPATSSSSLVAGTSGKDVNVSKTGNREQGTGVWVPNNSK